MGDAPHWTRQPPPRWLHCPRKSSELIGGRFLAFKTPLDAKFDENIPPECLFREGIINVIPSMLFSSMRSYKASIGLWIDLTNTTRFYDRSEVEKAENGGKPCRYAKLQCRGHGEAPSEDQVNIFVRLCRRFTELNPGEIIAVHCTHGFNRTGFLIAAYLIQVEDWSPEAAVGAFAASRPPGIYKEDYINELFRRFGDVSDAPAAPERPDWCFMGENTGVDEDGNRTQSDMNSDHSTSNGRGGPGRGRRREFQKKNPQFMDGVPGVTAVTEQPQLTQIQRKVQQMCEWKKNGFPGAQPVSMDRDNMHYLSQSPYKVSWKADGTRYMMLIDGKDRIFFVDRDNAVFQVHGLTFLHRKDARVHLTQTLLDGEMVIDEVSNQRFPRYLAYDIIKFDNKPVGQTNFSTRLLCIDKEIVGARGTYITQGLIDKTTEPFSIRLKQFWAIAETKTLLGPKFTKESLGHEPDGLIFQPSDPPYKCGRDDTVLKWKPSSHNSVDFKLKVVKENRPGMLPVTMGELYVGGLETPFATMPKLKKDLRDLNNKIIECTWDEQRNEWVFMRERTDKSYPNAYATANGVIKSIREPVTTAMLLDFIDHRQFRKPAAPPPPKVPRVHHN